MQHLFTAKKSGYFTVEATFVVTICIVVLMAVLYTGFYVHDRVVTEAVMQRQTTYWIHQPEEKKWSVERYKKKLEKEINKRLFLLTLNRINVEDGLITKTISVDCSLPVSLSFIKRIWGGKSGTREETVKVMEIWPARWKWDADAAKEVVKK